MSYNLEICIMILTTKVNTLCLFVSKVYCFMCSILFGIVINILFQELRSAKEDPRLC